MKNKILLLIILVISRGISGCDHQDLNDDLRSLSEQSSLLISHDYEWQNPVIYGDTTIISCKQILSYQDSVSRRQQKIYLTSKVKLWFDNQSIIYNFENEIVPTGFHIFTDTTYYKGNHFLKYLKILFDDGQLLNGLMDSEFIYSDNQKSVYPFVKLTDIDVSSIESHSSEKGKNICVELDIYGIISALDKNLKHYNIKLLYQKEKKTKDDLLLNTLYEKKFNWINDSLCQAVVEKTEIWQIKGENKEVYVSPELAVWFTPNNYKTLEVSDFSFIQSLKQDTLDEQPLNYQNWYIKKKVIRQSVLFSNNIERFYNIFEYPCYNVSCYLDGKTFEFDFDADFNETNYLIDNDNTHATHYSNATLKIAGKRFESQNITYLNAKTTINDDDNIHPYGKILNVYVSAVFDPAMLDTQNFIAKKCFVICYEKGYLWGVGDYQETFVKDLVFTFSQFTEFNSAAKKNAYSNFELAQVKENRVSLLWYNEYKRLISGIDALNCGIYNWPVVCDDIYGCFIKDYKVIYSNDRYNITIIAPNGEKISY